MRTNDPVVLSFARSVLEQADVLVLVVDTHMSIMEGSIGIFPRRLLVPDADRDKAERELKDAGLGDWLIVP